MADIDQLSIQIEASSEQAAKRISELTDELKRLQTVCNGKFGDPAAQIGTGRTSGGATRTGGRTSAGTPTTEDVSAYSTEVEQSTQAIDDNAGATERAVERTRMLAEQFIKMTSMAGILGRKMDDLKEKIQSAIDENDIAEVDRLTKQYKKLEEQLSKLNNGGPKSAFQVIASGAKLAFNGLKSLAKTAGKLTLKGITTQAKLAGNGLKSLAKTAGSSIVKPFKNAASAVIRWKNAIGRIAFYRVIRSAIKMITDGFKEGTQNLYQYSKLIGTDFAPSMDKLATSAQYLKNSIGAMAAPLIQAVAPAVDFLVDKFVELINVIGKAFAALTGKSTYSQAVKIPKAFADETKKANKEMRKFLLGIDELNIMSAPSGAGSAAFVDYGSMFEEVSIPTKTMDWAANIRESIEKGDWAGAGSLLAEKLNSVVSSVNTNELGSKIGSAIENGLLAFNSFLRDFNFENIGWKAAEFVNSLTQSINPETLGETLSSGIQTGVRLAYGFVQNFNFSEFGTWFSGVVNGWFSGIDWTKLGGTIGDGIAGIGDFLISFVSGLDWGGIGTAVKNLLISAFNQTSQWFENVDWYSVGNELYADIKEFISKIDYGEIAYYLYRLLGSALGSGVSLIAGFVSGVVDDIKNYFLQFIEDENGDGKFGGMEIVSGILSGILEGMKGIGTWIVDHIFNPFIDGFKAAFGIHSPSTVMKEQGGYIIEGLLNGIKGKFTAIGTWLKLNIVDPFVNKVKSLFGIKGTSSSSEMKDVGENLSKGVYDGIQKDRPSFLQKVGNWANSIVDKVKNVLGIHSPSTLFRDEIGYNLGAGVALGLEDSSSLITDAVSNIAETTMKIFDGISYDPNINYKELMNEASALGDWAEYTRLEKIRNAKIAGEGITDYKQSFDYAYMFDGMYIDVPPNSSYANRLSDYDWNDYGSSYASGIDYERLQQVFAQSSEEIVQRISEENQARTNTMTTTISEDVEGYSNNIINAVMAIGQQIVQAVNNKQTNFTLDGKQLARSMQAYNEQANRNKGFSFVRIGG